MPTRILIVEDESITAEDLRDILNELGYEVVDVVASGAEAIASAERVRPDLALMDIRIRGPIDGTEAAQQLRERFNIPVIYLTAHADRATVGRAKMAEPLGYITKPFQQSQLEAVIEIALHKHRADVESKRREDLLSDTLRAIGRGIISTDRAGIITLFNPAAEAWTGWNSADAIGQPVHEVLRLAFDQTEELAEPEVAPVLAHGRLGEFPGGAALLARDGGRRLVEGTLAPIRDHEGHISGAAIVFGEPARGSGQGPFEEAELADTAIEFGKFRLVAASPVMKRVVRFARRVAESEANTVLIEGESGTGKDVLANFMHYVGKRQDRQFVALNCAAIPETLLESELFGYEKGAFTDARSQKLGILEVASEGTVFLDEIGEMPVLVQAKMLRVLEDQTFRRLGGVRDIHVDLRIVAASNRRLSDAVKQGRFRLDLYYRLNVIQVAIPPLRERREDILPLAKTFIEHYSRRFKRNIIGLTEAAASEMLDYEWPGNVRELRNAIERAVLLEESDWIQTPGLGLHYDGSGGEHRQDEVHDLVEATQSSSARSPSAGSTLDEAERAMVIDALKKAGGNQTRAAALLGITRDTIRYKLKKYNLQHTSAIDPKDAASE